MTMLPDDNPLARPANGRGHGGIHNPSESGWIANHQWRLDQLKKLKLPTVDDQIEPPAGGVQGALFISYGQSAASGVDTFINWDEAHFTDGATAITWSAADPNSVNVHTTGLYLVTIAVEWTATTNNGVGRRTAQVNPGVYGRIGDSSLASASGQKTLTSAAGMNVLFAASIKPSTMNAWVEQTSGVSQNIQGDNTQMSVTFLGGLP